MYNHWSAKISQILDVEYRADFKITENIELVGAETKHLQNLVWTTVSSMESFQSREPLWMHSNQYLI